MPVISIQSLPFSPAIKVEQVLSQLSQAFSEQFNIQLEHVSANWRYLDRHHYVVAGKSAEFQCPYSHPILVELLAPDFTQSQDVENMLIFLACQLAKLTPIQKTNIFIEYRAAKSGWILDQGKIVRW